MSQESNSHEKGVAMIAVFCTASIIFGLVSSLRQELSESEFIKAKVVTTNEEYIGPDDNELDKRTVTIETDKVVKPLKLYRNLLGSTQDLDRTWQALQNSNGKCFNFELKKDGDKPMVIKKIQSIACLQNTK